MRKMVRAGAGIFDKQEPEPHKNGPAPQHCKKVCLIDPFGDAIDLNHGPHRGLIKFSCG
jgi:hypothetical protein